MRTARHWTRSRAVAALAGERIYDTLLGRLSDPSGPRKALLVCNPAGLTHWVHRRLVADETRDPDTRYVHVVLMDNAANLPPDNVQAMLQTRETRPAWFRSFILGEWGAFEGQAFPEFEDEIHVVRPFPIPDHWERFESLDRGAKSPDALACLDKRRGRESHHRFRVCEPRSRQ
jgi:hypothetical protein